MQPWPLGAVEVANAVDLALHLAAQESPLITVNHAADELDALHRLRPIIGKHRRVALWRRFTLCLRIGWIVAQMRILDQDCAGVDAKAVDAPIEPEAHDIGDR